MTHYSTQVRQFNLCYNRIINLEHLTFRQSDFRQNNNASIIIIFERIFLCHLHLLLRPCASLDSAQTVYFSKLALFLKQKVESNCEIFIFKSVSDLTIKSLVNKFQLVKCFFCCIVEKLECSN